MYKYIRRSQKKDICHVGLDVHKETIEIPVFRNWDQKPEFEKRMNNDRGGIISLLKKLQKNGRVVVCYEAACMGFTLKRALDEAGIDCHIVSPGKLSRRPTDKIKTDRLSPVIIWRAAYNLNN